MRSLDQRAWAAWDQPGKGISMAMIRDEMRQLAEDFLTIVGEQSGKHDCVCRFDIAAEIRRTFLNDKTGGGSSKSTVQTGPRRNE